MRLAWAFAGCFVLGACGGSAVTPAPAPPSEAQDGGPLEGGADAGPPRVDYLIVSAEPLMASAGRFGDFRRKGGHVVELASITAATSGASTNQEATGRLREFIRARYDARDPGRPFFVLLVGDADGGAVNAETVPVGTYSRPGAPPVSTDNTYADMDGDDVPDLAIGRIPARADADVDRVRTKIEANEGRYAVGAHNRRFGIFASTSGFGEPADSIIEDFVFRVIEEIPYDYDLSMTYANQRSPYVYVPERFSDQVYSRINEGAVMVTYVGHGALDGFATLEWNGYGYPILDTSQLSKIHAAPRAPILTLIACATGGFDKGDSVSERILFSEGGPTSVLSSTENSDPYPNALFVRELSQMVAAKRAPTLGEAFLGAKQRLIRQDDALRRSIDGQVGLLLDAKTREAQRRSHLYMYTLFGDPAARIAYPSGGATLTVAGAAARGAPLEVTGSVPALPSSFRATLTLESRRSAVRAGLKEVPDDGDPQRDAVVEANYRAANDKVMASASVTGGERAFRGVLAVPSDLPAGDYYVKVYAEDGARDAVASTKVTVR